MDEFELIGRYFTGLDKGPGVVLGVGDDAAILAVPAGEELVTSVDTVVEGVHFPADAFPEDVGYRAVAAAASDLAAMGARPLAMTLALTLPAAEPLWLTAFSNGVGTAASAFALPLVGGDTTRGAAVVVSVQVFGTVAEGRALRRAGARPGDRVVVSGTFGDAAAALELLAERWRPDPRDGEYLLRRFYRPQPRLALGQALLDVASAAIDVSDGLLADLGHIAAASAVAIDVEAAAVPLSGVLRAHPDPQTARAWALGGGDDYELAFTLPPGTPVPPGCSVIGEVVRGRGVTCDVPAAAPGYRHFAADGDGRESDDR
jgi:thiamine-monophosphate kinase